MAPNVGHQLILCSRAGQVCVNFYIYEKRYEEMKLQLPALCVVFAFLLVCVRATPRRLQRSKEGCGVCGRRTDEHFYEIPCEFVEQKDVRETFGMGSVGDGAVICKTCMRAVRRFKSTGTSATPRVCKNDFHLGPGTPRIQVFLCQ